ncbi:MAG TPA: substrate-binding domain-containing protein [Candidatus Limnocylindria bacterium]
MAAAFNLLMRMFATALVLGFAVAACSGPAVRSADPLAGTYIAATGEAAVPLAEALTKQLATAHPGMTWTVSEVGSSASISLVATGDADVAFITRELTAEDRTMVAATGLGYMGQLIAVNRTNPVVGLSAEQLRGIFGGRITDWSAVGGAPGPIRVFVRQEGSPTRAALDPLLVPAGAKYRADAISVPDASAMANALAASAGGIGMLSAPYVGSEANAPRAITIEGVAPTHENVATGRYAYRRPVYVVVRANESLVRQGARALLDLLRSDEGRRVLAGFF